MKPDNDIRHPDELTTREIEVMQMVCVGNTSQSIAKRLFISPRTVDVHRGNAGRKLKARTSCHAAVLFAMKEIDL